MSISDFAAFGRWHPLLVHAPIGFVLAALALELAASYGKLARPTLGLFLAATAAAAVLAASAGWVLGHEEGYAGATLDQHRRLGIAVASACVLAALLHGVRERTNLRLGLARVALVVAGGLLVPAGHLGGLLSHGDDWLEGPRVRKPRAPAASTTDLTDLTDRNVPELSLPDAREPGKATENAATEKVSVDVPQSVHAVGDEDALAILAERCTTCHGAKKKKGGLRLDAYAALLAGGDSGPALVPGDAAASLFFQRVSLPLEDEDHMPPEGKPQPTAEELARLEAWITGQAAEEDAGSDQDASSARDVSAAQLVSSAPPSDAALEGPGASAPSGPPPEALAALDLHFVHHEPLAAGSTLLWLDMAAVARTFGDAEFAAEIEPLGPWIGELSLARSRVGDASLPALARFPHLARLDLRASVVSSAGLAALRGHATLCELNLAQTHLTDEVVETLLALPALTRLTVWNAGLSAEAVARLRAVPGLQLVAGDEPESAVLEQEGELTFTSDRPLPGADFVPEALRPVNTICPVSGDPVNPKYTLVHTFADGTRVIGFCCPNCPKEFWSDPEKYAAALH